MLESKMEEAIAKCPDLFIESGLTLVRRQVVINGRRPDLLFSDSFSRQLLVEIQSGRLDENHLQRHFYYYFDYRAKYPSIHLRLMFIANRLVPQHKEFLDEHGYEYREYPEQDFARRISSCETRTPDVLQADIETVSTPGVLAQTTYKLLYEIEMQQMTLCYKMLLLMFMTELTDSDGGVSLILVAERFHSFFLDRAIRGKIEENPRRIKPDTLSRRTISTWERIIREQPVRYLTESFVIYKGKTIRWAPRIWCQWSAELSREIRTACYDRLIRYFSRHVPGGY
ncbi:endonuclease NucS domain-containing protein [Alloacidobacterium sp.]|uniref:endonuclease NucS domain-containing protein n=1 Tax=Alloacidobacterium sp. TaxID=2951999 RepID=UPI002D4AF2F4|nr:endonuclease NucS domain-containing protein [Alloacidobacterium sp.]HYK34892.1 endonuclease NucS domain-containing protein [Alloacidobacterium sp.]